MRSPLDAMIKAKTLRLERTYPAPADVVWKAWTDPDMLRNWWGPRNTSVPECTLDLRVGGRLAIVMEAGAGMGSYAGMRWPMEGEFTAIEPAALLRYDARSWTEGEEEGSTIHHTNEVTFTEANGATSVVLEVTIHRLGKKARMAAFGMKWGYKEHLARLDELLAGKREA